MPAETLRKIADGVAERGYAIVERFLPGRETSTLAAEALALWRAGSFARAGVGKRAEVREDERGDHVLWLDEADTSAAQRRLLARLESVRLALNRELALGLFDFEGHFALYPPGAGYRRHYDRFAGDTGRTVSLVLYLNRGWRAADGGELRLYDGERPIDVAPESGTLVAFLSDRFEHAVLRAGRERLSFTGWFRRRA
jgi:SM-20-related protein